MEASPFRFEAPVSPHELIGRDAEAAALRAYLLAGRAVSIAAPRRMGKTSLLGKVAADLNTHKPRVIVVRVDLLGLEGPGDFATRWASAWRRALPAGGPARRGLERALNGLAGLGVSVAGVGVQVSFPRGQDQAPVLQALLDLPRQAGGKVVVMLDEFQALFDAWPEGEGVLRGHVQRQLGDVSYVFSGSQPHLLEAAFSQQGRAFYNQVLRFPLGRLGVGTLQVAIGERFTNGGRDVSDALPRLLAIADGHPQRSMLLAHLLWEQVVGARTATPADAEAVLVKARVWLSDEMIGRWESLTPVQRAALGAVNRHGSAVVSPATDGPHGKASLQTAQNWLLRQAVIEVDDRRAGSRGGARYRLVDPMLGDWLEQRRR